MLSFAYLGCREEVAGFYESCGFSRIRAREFYVDRNGNLAVSEPGKLLYVFPLSSRSSSHLDLEEVSRAFHTYQPKPTRSVTNPNP